MNWKKIRYSVYAIYLILGLASAFFPQEHVFLTRGSGTVFVVFLVFVGIISILFPFLALPFILSIQAINPFSNEKWNKPEHSRNPLNLGDPIHFFHFCSWCGIAYFAGGFLVSPIGGIHQTVLTALGIIMSINMILSVKMCVGIFKGKFSDSEADPAGAINSEAAASTR